MASRAHIETIGGVMQQALKQSGLGWTDIDALAVTRGPGLPGSLVVGVNAAKGIALARNLPLIGVNHLEGHVYSHWLETAASGDEPLVYRLTRAFDTPFPLLVLIVSGGHTELVLMRDHGEYELIGHTVDDAVGEAFDKVSRMLNLGYPGGPAIQNTRPRLAIRRALSSPGPKSRSAAKPCAARARIICSRLAAQKPPRMHLVQQHSIDGQVSPYAPVADIAAASSHR